MGFHYFIQNLLRPSVCGPRASRTEFWATNVWACVCILLLGSFGGFAFIAGDFVLQISPLKRAIDTAGYEAPAVPSLAIDLWNTFAWWPVVGCILAAICAIRFRRLAQRRLRDAGLSTNWANVDLVLRLVWLWAFGSQAAVIAGSGGSGIGLSAQGSEVVFFGIVENWSGALSLIALTVYILPAKRDFTGSETVVDSHAALMNAERSSDQQPGLTIDSRHNQFAQLPNGDVFWFPQGPCCRGYLTDAEQVYGCYALPRLVAQQVWFFCSFLAVMRYMLVGRQSSFLFAMPAQLPFWANLLLGCLVIPAFVYGFIAAILVIFVFPLQPLRGRKPCGEAVAVQYASGLKPRVMWMKAWQLLLGGLSIYFLLQPSILGLLPLGGFLLYFFKSPTYPQFYSNSLAAQFEGRFAILETPFVRDLDQWYLWPWLNGRKMPERVQRFKSASSRLRKKLWPLRLGAVVCCVACFIWNLIAWPSFITIPELARVSDLTPAQAEVLVERFGPSMPGPRGGYRYISAGGALFPWDMPVLPLGFKVLRADLIPTLVRFEGALCLDSLVELDAATAGQLATHGGMLSLGSLRTLTPAVAVALSRHQGPLRLPAVRAVSSEVAEALAGGQGQLELNGLTSLTSVQLARKLAADNDGFLDLSGLKEIEPGVAAALATHTGCMLLDGLSELSAPAAEALSSHSGELWLNGLQVVSAEALKRLARHHEDLHLDGLVSLSVVPTSSIDVATALAGRENRVSLGGLRTLSAESAEVLKSNPKVWLPSGIVEEDR